MLLPPLLSSLPLCFCCLWQLKRFHPNKMGSLKFPLELDMKEFVSSPTDYRLAAVIIHKGETSDTGHYTALIANKAFDKWHLFNDERVEQICDVENFLTNKAFSGGSTAYLLFYTKVP